jgi:aminopeptidase
MDPRLTKLADVLVNYSIKVRPGDWVAISGDVVALDLIEEISRCVLQSGGHSSVFLSSAGLSEVRMRHSDLDQLAWISPIEEAVIHKTDARISLISASNTRALSGIDPEKQAAFQKSRAGLSQAFMQRSADGDVRWVASQFPCEAYAQEADMSLRDYQDFVYSATYADQDDPVAKWQEVHDRQQVLVDWLVGKETVEVKGPNIDLTLSIKGRTFINADGEKNMPDGEIFTAPVEDSVEGWVRFSYPALRGGMEVDGVEFRFEQGKVVQASAKKNEAYLLSQLDTDQGARYLGEFAIGTNFGIQRFTKNILFDEKIGGTLHMAVGAGYPETGSKNVSAVHWDFICDMREDSEIRVDGELFYKNGEIQI